MTKVEKKRFLIKALQRSVKDTCGLDMFPGYITLKELAVFLRIPDPEEARKYTVGCQNISAGYFIPDVAENLANAEC